MYQRPEVERFGTFRTLTQEGFSGASDGLTFNGTNGSNCQRFDIGGGQTTLTCIVGGSPRL